MKFVRQFDKMDCGPACISMVASAHGRDYPISYLRSLSHLTREGVSIAGLRDALREIGMESATFELTMEQLQEKCPLPAILHWDQNHFVVLCDVRRSRWTGQTKYYVANPAWGRQVLREDDFARHWTAGGKGVAIAVEPTEQFYRHPAIRRRHSLLHFARRYVWPFRWSMVGSSLGLLFGLALSLVSPFLTKWVVDDGIGMRDMNIVVSILIAQLFIFFGSSVMSVISSWVSLYMTTRININVLSDYLTKLLRLPMTFFETKSVGDYQQRLGDHGRLQQFVTNSTLQTLFALFSVPFYLMIVGWYSMKILGAYCLLTALATGWMAYFFRRRKALDYEQFAISSQNQNKQFELLQGITDIKLNVYEDYKLREWRELQERQYRMSKKVLKLGQVQEIGFTLIGQLRNILITYWIAAEVVNGNLTLGIMMSVSAIIGQINGPLSQLIGFLQQFQDARISLERSTEVHLSDDEDRPRQQADIPTTGPLDLEVRHLSFSYMGKIGNPALSDINVVIPAGKMTAIVGESGSGKTTLMKLLLKFYEPTSGEILLGGKNLQGYTAHSLRQACGIVMQDNFIFSDTVQHNICLGQHEEEGRLTEALRIACLENFVESHPLGLRTKIGSEGIGVSGGEKQRIMIARAVYKHPLYLMLDEATSSLDAENESRISEALGHRFRGCTRIVIAHRLSTVKDADNILVLKEGRIVESGTHLQLISARGYYYTLVQNQLELADNKG